MTSPRPGSGIDTAGCGIDVVWHRFTHATATWPRRVYTSTMRGNRTAGPAHPGSIRSHTSWDSGQYVTRVARLELRSRAYSDSDPLQHMCNWELPGPAPAGMQGSW